jgi:2-polyprenyl-3-methyl-5-hydroxy-6-metoxy-1,4-benzoquinol methylase
VVATDIADRGVATAQKLAKERAVNIEFRHLALQGWQWPDAGFDAVVAIGVRRLGAASHRGA